MSLSTGAKVGIFFGSTIVLAGIGFGIYHAVKKKTPMGTTTGGNAGGGSGGGSGATTTPTNTGGNINLTNLINQVTNGIALIRNYTAESMPLKPGMKGVRIKNMQDALRTKFNQLNIGSDGMFGVNTYKALRATGYLTGVNTSVSQNDYDNILLGVKKSALV